MLQPSRLSPSFFLTICLAAVAELHSNGPSTATKPTSLHTCAASALLNDAPPRAAAAQIKTLLLRVAAAVRGACKEIEPNFGAIILHNPVVKG